MDSLPPDSARISISKISRPSYALCLFWYEIDSAPINGIPPMYNAPPSPGRRARNRISNLMIRAASPASAILHARLSTHSRPFYGPAQSACGGDRESVLTSAALWVPSPGRENPSCAWSPGARPVRSALRTHPTRASSGLRAEARTGTPRHNIG